MSSAVWRRVSSRSGGRSATRRFLFQAKEPRAKCGGGWSGQRCGLGGCPAARGLVAQGRLRCLKPGRTRAALSGQNAKIGARPGFAKGLGAPYLARGPALPVARRTTDAQSDTWRSCPTPTERYFVALMAGARMSQQEICAAIGAARQADQDVWVDPLRPLGNGNAISRTTLNRHFKKELERGRAILKTKTSASSMMRSTTICRGRCKWACAVFWAGAMMAIGRWKLCGWGASRDMKIVFVLPTSNLRDEDRDDEGPRPGQRLLPPSRERPIPPIED